MFYRQGPILGWVFGVVIGNRDLWMLGVKNELIGLSICLICGELQQRDLSNFCGAFSGLQVKAQTLDSALF